jgi:predicted nucleic acid-binding protein
MAVADATVLIALAKMKRLGLLRQLYGIVTISPAVKAEVMDGGKAIAAPGVEQVETALSDGWIQVAALSVEGRKLAQRIARSSHLHEGEVESIALASSKGEVLIVDDKEARAMADAIHVEYLGTAAVLLRGFMEGHYGIQEFEDAIEALARTIWLSPAAVAEVLRHAREGSQ